MLDAAYVPSLWAAQKAVLTVLLSIILGPLSLASIMAAKATVHRHLANAARKRETDIRYPVRDLLQRVCHLAGPVHDAH